MNILRLSLLTNTIFSSLTGLILLFFTDRVVEQFALTQSTVFIIIGIGLLFFAFTVGLEINRQRPKKVNLIIVQDAIWVLASLVILFVKPFDISAMGYWIIGVVAIFVFLFGMGQWLGLKRLVRVS